MLWLAMIANFIQAQFLKQILLKEVQLMINLKSLERKAKETLQLLSDNDQSLIWHPTDDTFEPKSMQLKLRKTRETVTFENRHKMRLATADFTGKNIKNLIVPRVITFEKSPNSMREMAGKNCPRRDPRKKLSICSNRTLCSMESSSIEQEIQGIDFMKFWVRHRFQEKSIDSLVSRIESKRKQLRELRG